MRTANVIRLHPRQAPKSDVYSVVVYNSKRVLNVQVFADKKDALMYAHHMRQVGYRTKTLQRQVLY